MASRIDVVWTGLAGSPYFSSFFFDTAVDVVSIQACADAVHDFLSDIETLVSDELTWTTDGLCTNFNPATGDPTSVTGYTPSTGTGNDTNNVLPTQTQGLAQLHTGAYPAGREIRGRLFIPGPTENQSSAFGLPEGGYIGGIAGEANDLVNHDVGWSVWSRTNGALYEITNVTVWDKWAVLRSRRD
jgi:hypothetical protein